MNKKDLYNLIDKGIKEKEIRKAISNKHRKHIKLLKMLANSGEYDKEVLETHFKAQKQQTRETLRILNPAREQIKSLSKIKTPKYYERHEIKTRYDPVSKSKIQDAFVKRNPLTKSQLKNIENFRSDFKRQTRNAINRYARQNKAINLSGITTDFKGKKVSVRDLYTTYIKTSDKQLKTQARKSINKVFQDLRSIKATEIKQVQKRIITYNLEQRKEHNGALIDYLSKTWNFETQDQNNNIIGWDIQYSEPRRIIDGDLMLKGTNKIDVAVHKKQLEDLGIDFDKHNNDIQFNRVIREKIGIV